MLYIICMYNMLQLLVMVPPQHSSTQTAMSLWTYTFDFAKYILD